MAKKTKTLAAAVPGATDPRLGRIVEFDERSRQYPIRSLIAAAARPVSRTWPCRTHLDQGQTPSCVGHGWAHEIVAEPVIDKVTEPLALSLYAEAQALDGIAGAHEGSSVLAGAKAAKARGYYNEYRWAFGINDVVLALGYSGPVVLGVNWYDGMMYPDFMGRIRPTGEIAGGHCILAKGINVRTGLITLHQSWGRHWGHSGDCFISVADLDRLLREDGEACVPVGRQHPSSVQPPPADVHVDPSSGGGVVNPDAVAKPKRPRKPRAPKPAPEGEQVVPKPGEPVYDDTAPTTSASNVTVRETTTSGSDGATFTVTGNDTIVTHTTTTTTELS